MIKIIVTFTTCFVSVVMLVVAVSTVYWNQHTTREAGLDQSQIHYHYEGLFERCFDVYENDSYIESKSNCISIDIEVWNVIVVILLGISILLFIVAFVFAAIYSFYTRRSKYPLITNCSLIGLAVQMWLLIFSALFAFIAMMIYTFKLWENDIYFSWSYGAGWTTIAMALIGIVLIMADR